MSALLSILAAPTPGSVSTSPPTSSSNPPSHSSSLSLKMPIASDLPSPPPSSSSSFQSSLWTSDSSSRSTLFSSSSDSSTPAFTIPTLSSAVSPSPTSFPTSFSSFSSFPSFLKSRPLIPPGPSSPPHTSQSSSSETTVSLPSSTAIPLPYILSIPSTASTADSSPSVSQRVAPTRRHDERISLADWQLDAAAHVMRDFNEDNSASEQVVGLEEEEVVIGDSGEVLPTPERLDSASPNNIVFSSEEYMDDGEDFHNHSYILRCAESGSLRVDGAEARLTPHMAAALLFLCALLTPARGARPAAYDFGTIRTAEAFRAGDVALNGDGHGSLDVLYEGGAQPRTQDVNIFWQTCRPDPPGPEFSLDSGPLLPHSIVWSLFRKVRCGADREETFPGGERYFGDDFASADRASEELLPSYSDRHNYIIRCTPGEESLLVDGLEVRLTKHMESALGLLCFSSGLSGHENATRK